jgi:hypothetical protein
MAFKTNFTGYRLLMQCIFWQLSYFMPNLPIILHGFGQVSFTSTFWRTLGASAKANGSQLVCRESRNWSFKSGHRLWQTELVKV